MSQRYLVIGGTGSLGRSVIAELLKREPGADISVLSRGELKQKELKRDFPTVSTVIGDIKDKASLNLEGFSTVFHFAALKHIDVAEEQPIESVKTNVLGTINVAERALSAGVANVVFSSTDKAVLPINVYGMSKALSEKYLLDINRKQEATRFSVFRWGNVLGSRGAVIHLFLKDLKEKGSITITDPKMTRFWIHIDDAARFLLDNYKDAPLFHPIFPPMKAASVTSLGEAAARYLGIKTYSVTYSGIRRGEKFHECLWSDHDFCLRSDTCEHYSHEELLDLIRKSV